MKCIDPELVVGLSVH